MGMLIIILPITITWPLWWCGNSGGWWWGWWSVDLTVEEACPITSGVGRQGLLEWAGQNRTSLLFVFCCLIPSPSPLTIPTCTIYTGSDQGEVFLPSFPFPSYVVLPASPGFGLTPHWFVHSFSLKRKTCLLPGLALHTALAQLHLFHCCMTDPQPHPGQTVPFPMPSLCFFCTVPASAFLAWFIVPFPDKMPFKHPAQHALQAPLPFLPATCCLLDSPSPAFCLPVVTCHFSSFSHFMPYM